MDAVPCCLIPLAYPTRAQKSPIGAGRQASSIERRGNGEDKWASQTIKGYDFLLINRAITGTMLYYEILKNNACRENEDGFHARPKGNWYDSDFLNAHCLPGMENRR